jgi:hypothetical protein
MRGETSHDDSAGKQALSDLGADSIMMPGRQERVDVYSAMLEAIDKWTDISHAVASCHSELEGPPKVPLAALTQCPIRYLMSTQS